MLTNLLILDIETVPEAAGFSKLNIHRQELWQQKMVRYAQLDPMPPEESYEERAGILAEFGKIVCISTGYFYTNTQQQLKLRVKTLQSHNEKELLESFITLCNKMQQAQPQFRFAGHNIKEFDIPFICRRLVINQIPLPSYLQLSDKKPWETNMFDTLSWWRFGDYKNYVSLHLLATVLNIPTSKDDMDGSMVKKVYYEENNLERIALYCQKDVSVTANIILRFHNMPILTDVDVISNS